MTVTTKHPAWALKHKKSGTELRLIKGRYYLYEVSSKWNKEKKRAQKITGKILGGITEAKGFIPSGRRDVTYQTDQLSVKTSGIEPLCRFSYERCASGFEKAFWRRC